LARFIIEQYQFAQLKGAEALVPFVAKANDVFIQSTSSNRKLIGKTRFLYETI
jgi:hypothetical protein